MEAQQGGCRECRDIALHAHAAEHIRLEYSPEPVSNTICIYMRSS